MSVAPMLRTALIGGAVLAVAVAAVGSGIGWLIAGWAGVWGALFGASTAGVFLGLTAVSILVAGRVAHSRL